MRYPPSEKLEIIQLVEQSHLPAKRTLAMLGVTRSTFYRWYDRWREGGPKRSAIVPQSLAGSGTASLRRSKIRSSNWRSTRQSSARANWRCASPMSKYFVSESSVYRLLKAHDLITSPAYIVIKAADEFRDKTSAPNELWQTDFTYFKIVGWGWYYLSTILDDFSRFIVAWKLCATMRADDVTATLDLALASAGLDHAAVAHRPRLLSDNGPLTSRGLGQWLEQRA